MNTLNNLPLTAILYLTMLTGCTSVCTIKDPQIERIEVIKERIKRIKYEVPDQLLEECQWFHPIEERTIQSLAKTNKINADRFRECYYMNNAKARFLLKLQEEQGDDR